jgi:hypothetical protein
MYIYDDHSDIMKYSSFKQNVEEPYYIVDNDENFHMKIGSTTPKTFPSNFPIFNIKFKFKIIVRNSLTN